MPGAWIVRIWVPILVCMASPGEAQTSGTASAQELFKTHCAACHGAAGEGSRGPALRVPVLNRANDLDSMVSLLRRGVEGTEMRADTVRWLLVMRTSGRSRRTSLPSVRTLKTVGSGRTHRGAELFRTKGKCLACHRVNGMGRTLAPDLSEIGRQRDLSWLKRALLRAESDIFDSFREYRWANLLPENYLLIDLRTKSGERARVIGRMKTHYSVQIRDGEAVSVFPEERIGGTAQILG